MFIRVPGINGSTVFLFFPEYGARSSDSLIMDLGANYAELWGISLRSLEIDPTT